MDKVRVDDLGPRTLEMIRDAVRFAVEVWPNSHLGDVPTRQDIHSAFHYIRSRVGQGMSPFSAAAALYLDCHRYVDM